MRNRQHTIAGTFLLCLSKSGRVTNKLTVSGYAQRYDLVGNVVRIEETFAAAADDRIIKNLYDKNYRLVGEECYHGADRQRATYYVYDYAGNRLRKEVLTSSAPESEVTRYTYNALNQLLTVSGADEAEFDYDANGNRRCRTALTNPPVEDAADFLVTESGDNLITENGQNIIVEKAREEESFLLTESGDFLVTEDSQNLLVETATEDDDDVINLITESGDALITENGDNLIVERKRKPDPPLPANAEDVYEYDYENRLVMLTKTVSGSEQEYRYGYDYRTRRVFRSEGTGDETVSFSGGTSVSEWGSAGSQPIVEYIRGSDYGGGIGGILYTFRNSVPSFTHYDARGDVTQKTDHTGNITYQAQYEAFGARTKEIGSTQDRQKANTKDEDPTGLLCEGERYRDLRYGVFTTKDPAGFIDGPNLYTYVRQNPWSKFDPLGLYEDDEEMPALTVSGISTLDFNQNYGSLTNAPEGSSQNTVYNNENLINSTQNQSITPISLEGDFVQPLIDHGIRPIDHDGFALAAMLTEGFLARPAYNILYDTGLIAQSLLIEISAAMNGILATTLVGDALVNSMMDQRVWDITGHAGDALLDNANGIGDMRLQGVVKTLGITLKLAEPVATFKAKAYDYFWNNANMQHQEATNTLKQMRNLIEPIRP